MKRYKKIACFLSDAEKCLNNSASTTDGDQIRIMSIHFSRLSSQLLENIEELTRLSTLLKKLRESNGPGRQTFEERVMGSLSDLACTVGANLANSGLPQRKLSAHPDSVPPEQRSDFVFLQELCDYAIDCLSFCRARDSFAGTRRKYAFEILAGVVNIFELPETILTKAKTMLKSKGDYDVYGGLHFLEIYYNNQPNGFPRDVVTMLYNLVDKTERRLLAVSALQILVDSGHINKFQALERIGKWKEAKDIE